MRYLTLFVASTALTTAAFAGGTEMDHSHHHASHNHDYSYGPVGMMGDHQHTPGDWMVSYRYGGMRMDGMLSGDSELTPAEVRSGGGYMMSPVEMDMSMHMFGVMFGVNDKLTLMAMGNYTLKEMTMENNALARSKMKSNGLGDTRLTALYTLREEGGSTLHANLGVSLPTGSINERNNAGTKLPYGMQLGSGTVDPALGLTYNVHNNGWSWGVQANALLRLYDNSEDYHLGSEYSLTPFVSKELNDTTSVSFRLEGKSWGSISGADSELTANSSANDTANSGGERIDALVGINLYAPQGDLKGHSLGAEFGVPLYQNVNGYQMDADYRFTIGWRYRF